MGHLNRLVLRNYLGASEVDLELGPGRFFLEGQNLVEHSATSNGAGKSLVIESILWVLFGWRRPSVGVKAIIGPHGEDAYGRVEMTHRGRSIYVERTRTPTKQSLKLLVDGEDKSAHKDADTEVVLGQYLGFGKNTLILTSFDGLRGRDSFVEMTDAKLRKAIMRLLDLERFEGYSKPLTAAKNELQMDLREARTKLSSSMSVYNERKEEYDKLMLSLATFEDDKKAKIAQQKAKIGIANDHIDEKEDRIVELTGGEEYNKEQHRAEKAKLVKIEDGIAKMQRKIREKEQEIAGHRSELHRIERETSHDRKQLESLTNSQDGTCGTCGGLLSKAPDLASKLAEFRASLAYFEKDRVAAQAEIDKGRVALKRLEERLEKGQDMRRDQKEIVSRFDTSYYRTREVDKLRHAISGYRKDIELALERIEDLEASSNDGIHDRISSVEKSRDTRKSMMEDAECDVEIIEMKIDAIEKFKKGIQGYEKAIFNGFAMSMIDAVNSYFEEYLQGDYHCRLEQKGESLRFVFTNTSKAGVYYPFSIFSNGEQARIEKGVTVAIMKMLDLPFIVFDESFEGLDNSRPLVSAIMEAVSQNTLILASHRPELRDMFRSDPRIVATKTKTGNESAKTTAEVIRA